MARCSRIHTRFGSFDLVLWHRFQQRNLISTKTEKQEKTTQSKHIISLKKHSIWRFTRKTQKKRQNKSIKTWCLRSFVYFVVCLWCSWFVFGFSFCILGFKLFDFLFAMLLCFSWFNPLFCKMLLGSIFKSFCMSFSTSEQQKCLIYKIVPIRKCMKRGGDRLPHPENTCRG